MKKTIFAITVISIMFMLIAGCQEQNNSDSAEVKKSRLIAAENMELKKQLEDCNVRVEQCQQELKDAEEKYKKDIQIIMDFSIQQKKDLEKPEQPQQRQE